MRKNTYALFVVTMLLLAGMVADAQAFSDPYVDQAQSWMSQISYSYSNGRTLQSSAQLWSSKSGNCFESALLFDEIMGRDGYSTELAAIDYKNSSGDHNLPNDGHAAGIAWNSTGLVFKNENSKITQYSSVTEAEAAVGKGSIPGEFTITKLIRLPGDYDTFMDMANHGKINW